MKVLFLAFSVKGSSVADYFIQLANYFTRSHKVVIFTDTLEESPCNINPNIEILKWPSKRPIKFKDFLFLTSKVKEYQPEFMISNFGAVNMFILVGFLFHVKHRICWSHTLASQLNGSNPVLYLRKGLIYGMATKVISNSNSMKKELQKGLKVKNVMVFYNAVRESPVIDVTMNPKKIVYVGRMHPSKGVSVLINAMKRVVAEFPEVSLEMVGGDLNGIEIKEYKELVHKLELESNIHFSGSQSKAKVLQEFAEAYVAIVPSLAEAFGYVVIESFSVSTPVIGSNTGGIAEIIRNNVDGFLVEPGNSDELAEKIILLLKNPELRKKLSDNCYLRFKDSFELSTSIENLYKHLVD